VRSAPRATNRSYFDHYLSEIGMLCSRLHVSAPGYCYLIVGVRRPVVHFAGREPAIRKSKYSTGKKFRLTRRTNGEPTYMYLAIIAKIKVEHFTAIYFCKINIAIYTHTSQLYTECFVSVFFQLSFIFFITMIAICIFNGIFLIGAQIRNVSAFVITNNKIIARVIMPFRYCNVAARAYYVNLMHYCIQLLMNYEIN